MTLTEANGPKHKRRSTRGQKRVRGMPNALDAEMAELLAEMRDRFGPAMRALPSDRHRAFVLGLFRVKPGYGANVRACKLAGFGTSTTTAKGWSALSSIHAHEDGMQAAIREWGEKRLCAAAPHALYAVDRMIRDPEHKDHARAVGMVLDRVHPVETVHHVKTEHTERLTIEATEQVLARIAELTRRAGLDPASLPPLIGARQIEGECVEVNPQAGGKDDAR